MNSSDIIMDASVPSELEDVNLEALAAQLESQMGQGAEKWDTIDGSQSGPVHPITTCPHLESDLVEPSTLIEAAERDLIDTAKQCFMCEEISENWSCLTCYAVGCSRWKNMHGVQHFLETNHHIALSHSDFSVWCYVCDTYIKNPSLDRIVELAHLNKFGITVAEAKASKGKRSRLTGRLPEEEVKEIFDPEEQVITKVKQLADMIRSARHVVIYTGAGISTAAKLPDYRGPQGVWTMRDKGLTPTLKVSLTEARPTYTHMGIRAFLEAGVFHFVVSTNVDGLHRRSGIGEQKISELHGNCYLEKCSVCNEDYLRDFNVGLSRSDHRTGRTCSKVDCDGHLVDSIINFGEKLPIPEVEKTYVESKQSDLAIVLGTSMRVQPANMFPAFALENQGHMVICNLQETPYDAQASLLIHARVDDIMLLLSQELGIEVLQYDPSIDPVKPLSQDEEDQQVLMM